MTLYSFPNMPCPNLGLLVLVLDLHASLSQVCDEQLQGLGYEVRRCRLDFWDFFVCLQDLLHSSLMVKDEREGAYGLELALGELDIGSFNHTSNI